jgi:hypothetical protein
VTIRGMAFFWMLVAGAESKVSDTTKPRSGDPGGITVQARRPRQKCACCAVMFDGAPRLLAHSYSFARPQFGQKTVSGASSCLQ